MQPPNSFDIFRQEAEDLLTEIESTALELSADDLQAVHRIFRAFHTIKGSGSMFGFDAVAEFTHHVETLLDQAREGLIPVTGDLSNVILSAVDHIKHLLDPKAIAGAEDEAALLAKIAAMGSEASSAPSLPPAPAPEPVEALGCWKITFRPNPSFLARGGSPLLLLRDLRELGECQIEGHADDIPQLVEMDPEECYLWWSVVLRGSVTQEAIENVFLFVQDGAKLEIESVAASPREPAAGASEQAAEATEAVSTADPANSQASGSPAAKEAKPNVASVRVPVSRLDRLVNLVGELVMNQSRLADAASGFHSTELAVPVEEIQRLVAELRDDVLQIRMMPIGTIFGRFRRLVHDLSQQLGKRIALVTEGEETELDKGILDQLAEPLVHLLRNSIDHGVEKPEVRKAAGKPEEGTILLRAAHTGSDVVVTIQDDGAGLNRAAIRKKAVERGLITPDASLSDKEIYNLILQPGFSTSESVTNISGRGVGMDVVKRQIDALSGSLAISSEEGRGAQMSLRLPLTLAIIDGLLVEVGDSQYIIPMAAVTENVELSARERGRNNGRNVIPVRGELIPYIDLRETFQTPGEPPALSKVVLVRYQDQRVGLAVDRVMGTHQTVIQVLGRFFRKIQVVSGSTIMGNGRVALILDIAGIVRIVESRNAAVIAA